MVLAIKSIEKDLGEKPVYASTDKIPSIHEQITKDGYSVCRMLNGIMHNTYVSIYIDIGGIRHRCIEFYPLYGEFIKVKLYNGNSVEVPWYTDFVLKLGHSFQEFRTMNRS